MSPPKKEMLVSREYIVIEPPKELAYPIPKSGWNRIKQRIINIESKIPFYQNVGYCLLGISASAFIYAATSVAPTKFDPISIYFGIWVFAIISLTSAILFLYFGYQQSITEKNVKDDIIKEMESYEPPPIIHT